jgi:glutamate carboxypeptidase
MISTIRDLVEIELPSDNVEVGTDSSRAITEASAKRAAAVLVLEPSYGKHGAAKTARKEVGEYLVKITSQASHAGLDFETGVNAIRELAYQIEKISTFTELKKGLTVNVGIVSGGTRTVLLCGRSQVPEPVARNRSCPQ